MVMTGDFGDDWQYSTLQGLRGRFAQNPTTGACQTFHHSGVGTPLEYGVSSVLADGKFDVLRSARFHRAQMTFTGNMEMIGYQPRMQADGER